MTSALTKRVTRYGLVTFVIAGTAWFAYSFAHRKAAEILEPYALDLIDAGDTEGLDLLLTWRPEVMDRTAFPQKNSFVYTKPDLPGTTGITEITSIQAQDYPLNYAAATGKTAAARILLEHGADIHLKSGSGESVLFVAVASGNIETTKLLCRRGANPNELGRSKLPAIFYAPNEGVALALADAGSDLKFTADDGLTVLHNAAALNSPRLAQRVLAAGINPNSCDSAGETALHRAAMSEATDCIEVLLKAGAKVNAADEDGETPLLCAAACGNVAGVKVLLDAGADPNHLNADGANAFHRAVQWASQEFKDDDGHIRKLIRLLHNAGVSLTASDRNGKTPLDLANRCVRKIIADSIPELNRSSGEGRNSLTR